MQSNTAAKEAIESLLDNRPITKELINAGIVEECECALNNV